MRVGDRIALGIERMSTGGEGVGRADGMVVFVPYAAPSDRLEVEITQTHKRFARARILNLVEPSKDRVTPPCPYHYGGNAQRVSRNASEEEKRIAHPALRIAGLFCGGCTWQHLAYDAQLRAKQALVQE